MVGGDSKRSLCSSAGYGLCCIYRALPHTRSPLLPLCTRCFFTPNASASASAASLIFVFPRSVQILDPFPLCAAAARPMAPVPEPRSPPPYPDFCGRRRLQLEVQMLNREIDCLREELESVEGAQPVSRCCKEVNEFVGVNQDPLIPIIKKRRRSCRFWKWIRSKLCCCFSPICCCGGCSLSPEKPCCSCRCPSLKCCGDCKCSCCLTPCCRPSCGWPKISCCKPRCLRWEDLCCKLRCCCSAASCCQPGCPNGSLSCPGYSCGCIWSCPQCTFVRLCPRCSKTCCVSGCEC